MRSIGNAARPVIWIVLLVAFVLSGCSGLMRSHFGIRPDEPPPGALAQTGGTSTTAEQKTCDEYKNYAVYAQQLQEAYHSRASQNRAWIYVAAVLGLGVAAASGGLAVATAVGVGTLGLLSISGGFSAAAFATISNADLAQLYTIAANQVDLALKESDAKLSSVGADGTRYDGPHCARALRVLKAGVSEARTTLEVNRTNTAVGAIARAVEQRKALDAVIAGVQAGNPTQVTLSAEITEVNPAEQSVKGEQTPVTLTIKNIRLNQVALTAVKVLLGSTEIELVSAAPAGADNTYTVKFMAPADPPDPPEKDYAPILLIVPIKQRVGSTQGQMFKYK